MPVPLRIRFAFVTDRRDTKREQLVGTKTKFNISVMPSIGWRVYEVRIEQMSRVIKSTRFSTLAQKIHHHILTSKIQTLSALNQRKNPHYRNVCSHTSKQERGTSCCGVLHEVGVVGRRIWSQESSCSRKCGSLSVVPFWSWPGRLTFSQLAFVNCFDGAFIIHRTSIYPISQSPI